MASCKRFCQQRDFSLLLHIDLELIYKACMNTFADCSPSPDRKWSLCWCYWYDDKSCYEESRREVSIWKLFLKTQIKTFDHDSQCSIKKSRTNLRHRRVMELFPFAISFTSSSRLSYNMGRKKNDCNLFLYCL